jgi:acyl-CoA thioesterase
MLEAGSILALRSLGQDTDGSWRFQSDQLPRPLNYVADVAFGGSTLAQAIHAAYQTIEPAKLSTLRLYSVLGHFYGATRCSVPLDLKVTALRDTRGFATRQVTVSQSKNDKSGKTRTTSVILVDFIAKAHYRTVLSFSAQPKISPLTHPSKLQDIHEKLKIDAESGVINKKKLAFMTPFFDLLDIWHNRYCPEGVLEQQSIGLRLDRETDQKHLPHAEKASYDWIQLREKQPIAGSTSRDNASTGALLPPSTSAASACLFAYFLDTWISVIAPWWAHIGLGEAQVYATLDFALRFHVDELDAGEWHLREHTALSAGDERDYVQANLWREIVPTVEGGQESELKMVATMTQTCTLKGPPREGSGRSKM